MNQKQEFSMPVSYFVGWNELSAPSLIRRKELETDLLDALVALVEAHGGTDIEIGDIIDSEDGLGKTVHFTAYGNIDAKSLGANLRHAADGFE